MSDALTIRQQIAPRPGSLYDSAPRSLSFSPGSLFSFPLHSTAYEDSDAATIRIPPNVKLCLHAVGVDRKEMVDFVKTSGAHGVSLKFASEENGGMLAIWTYDKDRSAEVWQTGLGIEGEWLCAARGLFGGGQASFVRSLVRRLRRGIIFVADNVHRPKFPAGARASVSCTPLSRFSLSARIALRGPSF